MNKIIIPYEVKSIIHTLSLKGHKAYVVGGCVRDSLLGITPKDWDICTSATPEEVKECFSKNKIIETGLKHGTVTLVFKNNQYEITTFRIDGDYYDSRHPSEVIYVDDLKKDLLRRDFTINALCLDRNGNLIDLKQIKQCRK